MGLVLAEEGEEFGVFHEVRFFDLLLVADGEEDGEFRDVFVTMWAMIEVGAAGVTAGRDVGLFVDSDEVLDVIVRVLDGLVVADHHGREGVELLFGQGYGAGTS